MILFHAKPPSRKGVGLWVRWLILGDCNMVLGGEKMSRKGAKAQKKHFVFAPLRLCVRCFSFTNPDHYIFSCHTRESGNDMFFSNFLGKPVEWLFF